MAFKFKVKKRPNLAQAVAGAFTQGAVQGGQAALQKMIKDREDLKQQSTKELNLYSTLTSNLSQTADNKKLQADAKLQILKGSSAQDVFTAQKDDFQYSSSVATEPIYNPDTGEVLAYKYGKNVLYPQKTTTPVSGITVAKKREVDIARQKLLDQRKRLEYLEEKDKANKLAPGSPNLFPPLTQSEQASLDRLKNVEIPKSAQGLDLILDSLMQGETPGLETPVPKGTPEPISSADPFAKFLDTRE